MEKAYSQEHMSEKTALLEREVKQSKRVRGQRTRFVTGSIIAIILFTWWSFIVIPNLLGLGSQDSLETDEGKDVDFDDVSPLVDQVLLRRTAYSLSDRPQREA